MEMVGLCHIGISYLSLFLTRLLIPAPLSFDRGAFVINDIIPTAVITLVAVVFAFSKRVKTPDNIIWVVDIVAQTLGT